MSTIILSHVAVTPCYDSGTFMHFSTFNSKAKGYCSSETNIQSAYNLNDNDFITISVIIAQAINTYIKAKD